MQRTMKNDIFDVIVVGSGAGGAAVAHGTSKRGRSALLLEAGPDVDEPSLGRFFSAVASPGYYKRMAIFSRSAEGSIIYHTSNLGGSTVFACGNMMRPRGIEVLLARDFGMNGLNSCFEETEVETSAGPLPMGLMSPGAIGLSEASARLGLHPEPALKGFMKRKNCRACGNCIFGCRYGAKWDSRAYLTGGTANSISVRTGAKVEEILFEGRKTTGVVVGIGRKSERINARTVVVAAGALNTPRLLQKAGIHAGSGLFVDYFGCVYGLGVGIDEGQLRGRSMPTIIDRSNESGFILSPFVDDWTQYALFTPLAWKLRRGLSRRNVLGIMVKIADDRSGRIDPDGSIHKEPTQADRARLEAGMEVARSILREAGCRDLVRTRVWRGAHPGGTAAMGEVVDNELKVKDRDGLYVCDASVLPFAPGIPPILTISAIGKWLGKRL
jgi:choline dehydrogenase-like flavoprotein